VDQNQTEAGMRIIWIFMVVFVAFGCSVVGKSDVEEAPYFVLSKADDPAIEVRRYERLVLVSASMPTGLDGKKNKPFRQLFNYITGSNEQSNDIPMTAPVFMDDQGTDSRMSFVLPQEYTLATAPQPTNPDVSIHGLSNLVVAAIRFNGRLTEDNIQRNREVLEQWISTQPYTVAGSFMAAGYNPPFTLPSFRRNEVLIPVELDD